MKAWICAALLSAAAFASAASPSAQTVAELSARLQELQAQGFSGVQWQPGPPMGSNYLRIGLTHKPCCDQYDYTALVPIGAVAPGAPVVDFNDAQDFFLERSGGKTGQASYAGPFSVWSEAAIADFVSQHEVDLKSVPGVKSVKATCMLQPNRCLEMLWVVPEDNVTIPQLTPIRQEIIKRFPELRNARIAVTFIMPA